MEINVRVLTVSSIQRAASGNYYYLVPKINLQGKWLENCGFTEGKKIAVSVGADKLIITAGDQYENEKNHRAIVKVNKHEMNEGNVIVQYKDKVGIWRKSMLNTIKEGNYYRVATIPYGIISVAMGDLIEAEEEYGLLFFVRVVQVGGNRVVYLDLRDDRYVKDQLLADLKATGCTWISRYKKSMSINIPLTAPWDKLIAMFDFGASKGYWVYQQTRF
jgi:Toxin SymE, type I toxin-antitoxin system/Domain of unknown function (DUF4265)